MIKVIASLTEAQCRALAAQSNIYEWKDLDIVSLRRELALNPEATKILQNNGFIEEKPETD